MLNHNVVDKIKADIKDWRKVSTSDITPKRDGEEFEDGWRLGINRVCNSIEKVINKYAKP